MIKKNQRKHHANRTEVFTIKIILKDVFQCPVNEIYAPQSLWRENNVC